MSNQSAERRTNPRMQIDGKIAYKTNGSDDIQQGRLENLSIHGARIWINQELPTDSQLLFRVIEEGQEDAVMDFKATLLHQLMERKESLYGYGCIIEESQFTDGKQKS